MNETVKFAFQVIGAFMVGRWIAELVAGLWRRRSEVPHPERPVPARSVSLPKLTRWPLMLDEANDDIFIRDRVTGRIVFDSRIVRDAERHQAQIDR